MDPFIAYQLEQILIDNKTPSNTPNILKGYIRQSKNCSRCGQNLYFCQCFNNKSYINGKNSEILYNSAIKR